MKYLIFSVLMFGLAFQSCDNKKDIEIEKLNNVLLEQNNELLNWKKKYKSLEGEMIDNSYEFEEKYNTLIGRIENLEISLINTQNQLSDCERKIMLGH